MRYMCLVHFDSAKLDAMNPEEHAQFDHRVFAADQELHRQGRYIHAEALQDGASAKLVRVRDTGTSITDGPYIETREQMAGFILIEARDLNDAIASFQDHPMAEIGTLEIRPIFIMPTPTPA